MNQNAHRWWRLQETLLRLKKRETHGLQSFEEVSVVNRDQRPDDDLKGTNIKCVRFSSSAL
jgi:hypothetical protein